MRYLAFGLMLLAIPARADVVVVLNDVERSALISAIAAGLQAQPSLLQSSIYLLNKIHTAPVMTGQTEVKPAEDKDKAQ